MKEGPDIALLGALIGDPALANILTALMSGKALTAAELAAEAGVTAQTASAHLKKLEAAVLIRQRRQGRHRYFALADAEVGALLESMMGLAARRGLMRTRTGPRDAELCKARVCYNHLAGELGVFLYDGLIGRGILVADGEELSLTAGGARFISGFGIDLTALSAGRRPLCRSCLDWSSRRTHLAGALGTALLQQIYGQGWASRCADSRAVRFAAAGERRFRQTFGT